ncbi:MAG: hypothetical protein WAU01_00055 [Saprospiraceae bacterium]
MSHRPQKLIHHLLWLILICAIAYFKYYHHELWKDEWQAWFVAKDKSISDIFSFLYYEGHPALWYLYLKVFTPLSGMISPANLLNTAHLLTVAGGLYILIVKFRISTILKIAIALSYFVFFEYGIVNRGYFLVVLFLFWSVSLMKKEQYSKTFLGILLFLLCQTEVYGAMMALTIGVYLYLSKDKKWVTKDGAHIIGLLLGMLVFIVSVFPRSAGHVSKTKGKELSLPDQVLTSFQGNLSNNFLIGSTPDTFTYGWTWVGILLSLLCVIGLWYIFRSRPNVQKTMFVFLIGLLVFSAFIFLGGIRQWGMGMIFFVAMLELADFDIKNEKWQGGLVAIFCIFGMVHGIKAVREEVRLPFTNAKAAGLFIKDKIPAKVPIIAINKFEATPVIGYADRKFFELPDGKEFSYFRWVDKIYLPTENEIKLFANFKSVGGVVILSPQPLDGGRFPTAQLWQKFDQLNYKNENYYLYTLAVK